MAGRKVLLEAEDGRAPRRAEGRGGGGATDAGEARRVAPGGEEGDRRQPRACGRDGGGVGWAQIDDSR
ncbi:MAG: hypothetical protein Q4D23_10885 [Bacteroidales bacterium]|nr:hypothetical protein [Bacteroidales bacterium]